MGNQVRNGKAFEYSLLTQFYERLYTKSNNVSIVRNASYNKTFSYFESLKNEEQQILNLVSSAAVNFLVDIEPRLSYGISNKDILELEIMPDSAGKAGDVRDLIAVRSLQKWEIGFSAKNNHRAVKHSRLSPTLDFGNKWLNLSCSQNYFDNIKVTFDFIKLLKSKDQLFKWSDLDDIQTQIYLPVLSAFKSEMDRLNKSEPKTVAQNLIMYLVGNRDFYKIIKGNNDIEIQAYNINGTLNLAMDRHKPKAKIPKLKLPSRLIEIDFAEGKKNTLIAHFDEGWQLSMRIHNASTKLETSLKFDMQLISAPYTLFTNHIFYGQQE